MFYIFLIFCAGGCAWDVATGVPTADPIPSSFARGGDLSADTNLRIYFFI